MSGQIAHVRPDHVRVPVGSVGEVDVVAVEDRRSSRNRARRPGRTATASGATAPCSRSSSTPGHLRQRRVVERRISDLAVVVEHANRPVRRVDVDPREPLVGRAGVDLRQCRPGCSAVVEVIRKTSVFVTGFAESWSRCGCRRRRGQLPVLGGPRARHDVAGRARRAPGSRSASGDRRRSSGSRASRPRGRRRSSGSTTCLPPSVDLTSRYWSSKTSPGSQSAWFCSFWKAT